MWWYNKHVIIFRKERFRVLILKLEKYNTFVFVLLILLNGSRIWPGMDLKGLKRHLFIVLDFKLKIKSIKNNFSLLPLYPPLISFLIQARDPDTHSDIWQHNTTAPFPLTASHLLFSLYFLLYFFPLRIYNSNKHTLLPRSLSRVKPGSDWTMPGCRYSALFKSIFPTVALTLLSLASLISPFLSPQTCLSSKTSFSGCSWLLSVRYLLSFKRDCTYSL